MATKVEGADPYKSLVSRKTLPSSRVANESPSFNEEGSQGEGLWLSV